MPDNKNPKQKIIDEYKKSVRQAESGNNPNAKADTSTATGLYQFTEATWKEMEKKIGKKLDIFNTKDQEEAMNKLTEINANALEKAGIAVTPANLYMTHFLGASGGPRFLKNLEKNPNELASMYVKDSAVNANRNLFYNNDKPVTAAELYNKLSSKVGGNTSAPKTIQAQEFTPQIPEVQIDNTSVEQPRVDPSLNQGRRTLPKQVTDTEEIRLNPIESTRSELGLSGSLDFLPRDINLAFSEEEQLQEQLDNPDELINIAEYGGKQNSTKTLSNGLLNEFNEGESHEENKFGGIPQGIGTNGKLNTVEEGESKFNDYVFSDTLIINENDIESLFLPKEIKGMTFSEAGKYINDVLKDNPNDRIIKKTVEKQLDSLTLGNEKARLAKEELDINLNKSLLNTEDTNEMFLGGEESSLQETSILGGLQGINSIVQGDEQTGIKDIAKSGLSLGVEALLPGAGQFASPVFDLADNIFSMGSNKKDEQRLKRREAIINSSAFSNDFEKGGDLLENNINDPKYIPTPEDFLNFPEFNLNNNTLNNNNLSLSSTDLLETNDYSNPNTGIYNTNSRQGTTSETTEVNPYRPKQQNPLQYAPVLGDFLNFNDARNDSPEVENLNSLSTRFNPNYADEAYLQNIVSNDFDNTVNSLTNASNGSSASLRANILGANANRVRGLSDAYFKIDDTNRNQDLQGQQFNLGIDQFNIGQDNQERDINARNRSAVEDRERASRDALFRDLGAIGREQTYDNRLYNLTGGYDSMGNYNPNRMSFLEELGLVNNNKETNENKEGGMLSNMYSSTLSNKKKMEDIFNKKYK